MKSGKIISDNTQLYLGVITYYLPKFMLYFSGKSSTYGLRFGFKKSLTNPLGKVLPPSIFCFYNVYASNLLLYRNLKTILPGIIIRI